MTVTIKGGEQSIEASHRLLEAKRRGDLAVPALSVDQIRNQLSLAVDRVMAEGSLYDPTLAALAIKQAQGDLIEAIFILRAYRTTLERFGTAVTLDTAAMVLRRRISTTHKDVPGGQTLGPTYDYTHRLLDFALMNREAEAASRLDDGEGAAVAEASGGSLFDLIPSALVETELPSSEVEEPHDLTRQPLSLPAERDQRLQALARGDEGFLQGMAYSTMRGFGRNHPFVAELRHGDVAVDLVVPELGFDVTIGDITITECQTVHAHPGNEDRDPMFTRGYGLSFGHCERRAISMAILDRSLRTREIGDPALYPAQDEEFVLLHSDNVEASGLVQHLKLPHYVDFQAELQLLRQLRAEHEARDATSQEIPDAAS
jgi:alpha-D-ribose 1-methylphosphonate 5-triphosphate synthase subunit PhnI